MLFIVFSGYALRALSTTERQATRRRRKLHTDLAIMASQKATALSSLEAPAVTTWHPLLQEGAYDVYLLRE